jgi:hypothetical protein
MFFSLATRRLLAFSQGKLARVALSQNKKKNKNASNMTATACMDGIPVAVQALCFSFLKLDAHASLARASRHWWVLSATLGAAPYCIDYRTGISYPYTRTDEIIGRTVGSITTLDSFGRMAAFRPHTLRLGHQVFLGAGRLFAVCRMSSLRCLDIWSLDFGMPNMVRELAPIGQLSALVSLTVRSYSVSIITAMTLFPSSLRSLCMLHTSVSAEEITSLSVRCPQLEMLEFNDLELRADVALPNFSNWNTYAGECSDIRVLASISSLTCLDLYSRERDDTISLCFPHVRSLTLRHYVLEDNSAIPDQMPLLQRVVFHRCGMFGDIAWPYAEDHIRKLFDQWPNRPQLCF